MLISARLTDFSGMLFASDALPLTPVPINGLYTTFSFSDIVNGNQVEIGGSITSVTAVPEPATMWLVGAGLGGLIRRRRLVFPDGQ
jgi:hypothetical protein